MEEPERRRRSKRSSRGSRSPPCPPEEARLVSKKKSRSSNKRRKRSRSPRQVIGKIKQERQDHPRRGHEEHLHRDHSELEQRWGRSGDRGRHRDHSSRRKARRERSGSHEREADQLQEQQAQREFYNERRREHRQQLEASGDEENRNTGRLGSKNTEEESGNKEKPSFELSGALVEDTNTFRGVVIKYSEPPEARIPKKRWRLYPFKNDEVLPVMYIHRQSAYLLGRHRRIADIPIDHPSCSKQHAVFQYRIFHYEGTSQSSGVARNTQASSSQLRILFNKSFDQSPVFIHRPFIFKLVEYTRPDGTTGRKVKPYIIDLGSGNGTFLNNQRIEPQRYYELKEKDVLKFGFSSREYVLLHESSDTSEVDQKKEEDEEEEEEEST